MQPPRHSERTVAVREKAGVAPSFPQISETSLLASLSSPILSSICSRKSKKWLETVIDPPFLWLAPSQHGLTRALSYGSELRHSDTDGLVCVSPLHSF